MVIFWGVGVEECVCVEKNTMVWGEMHKKTRERKWSNLLFWTKVEKEVEREEMDMYWRNHQQGRGDFSSRRWKVFQQRRHRLKLDDGEVEGNVALGSRVA